MEDLEKRIEAVEAQMLVSMGERAREFAALQMCLKALILHLGDAVQSFSPQELHSFLMVYIESEVRGGETGTVAQYKGLINDIIVHAS